MQLYSPGSVTRRPPVRFPWEQPPERWNRDWTGVPRYWRRGHSGLYLPWHCAVAHVAAYTATSNGAGNTSLTAGPFTPNNDDILVISLVIQATQGGTTPTASGGSLTYNIQQEGDFGAGSDTHYHGGWTAVVAGSPGSMSVTLDWSSGNGGRSSLIVERYSGGDPTTPIGATAIDEDNNNSTSNASAFTTNNANSMVSSSIGTSNSNPALADGDQDPSATFVTAAHVTNNSALCNATSEELTTSAGSYPQNWNWGAGFAASSIINIEINEASAAATSDLPTSAMRRFYQQITHH